MRDDRVKSSLLLQVLGSLAVLCLVVFYAGSVALGYVRLPPALTGEKPEGPAFRFMTLSERYQKGDYKGAIEAANRIIIDDAGSFQATEAKQMALRCYMRLKEYGDAVMLAQELSNENPQDIPLRLTLAEAFAGYGELQKAQMIYLEVAGSEKATPDVKDHAQRAADDIGMKMGNMDPPATNDETPPQNSEDTPPPTENTETNDAGKQ